MRRLFCSEVVERVGLITTSLQRELLDQQELMLLAQRAKEIKGSARIAKAKQAQDLANAMEEWFDKACEVSEGENSWAEEKVSQLLLECCDCLQRLAEQGLESSTLDDELTEQASQLIAQLPTVVLSQSSVASADFPQSRMRSLYWRELGERVEILTQNLLELEQGLMSSQRLETMMRMAHTIKGGARLAELEPVTAIAHVMEDIFVRAQERSLDLSGSHTDRLLQAVDVIVVLSETGTQQQELNAEAVQRATDITRVLEKILEGEGEGAVGSEKTAGSSELARKSQSVLKNSREGATDDDEAILPREPKGPGSERVIRVDAEKLNRVIGLAGELTIEVKQLNKTREQSFRHLRAARKVVANTDNCFSLLDKYSIDETDRYPFEELLQQAREMASALQTECTRLESHELKMSRASDKLFRESIDHRMRPFKEGTEGLHRLVRSVAQRLDKQVQLQIVGEETRVDRDILERLNVPLTHLIQNAIDHGIEKPEQREALGKRAAGTLRLEARHKGGMLSVTVTDDGSGVDLEALRQSILSRKMATPEMVSSMSEVELFDFLLLPNFTLKETVSTVSGRGVGMDIVRDMVQEVRGRIEIHSEVGTGTCFELLLPITLSMSRCVVLEVSGHSYALPVGSLNEVLSFEAEDVGYLENRQYISGSNGQPLGLIKAHQLLGLEGQPEVQQCYSAIVLGRGSKTYALSVDRLQGETLLVERPIDERLGQLQDVSAAAFLDNGTPVLILNVEDLLHSIEHLIGEGDITSTDYGRKAESAIDRASKRVLVVDDSLTVRELERGLLTDKGYRVDVAVDGADGWNRVRLHDYDLVISDIDMPRMNGIEFVGLIRKEPRLRDMPVIIVSYKDREQDKKKGMEVGADYYLTKGSFIDESFIRAVRELIGDALIDQSVEMSGASR